MFYPPKLKIPDMPMYTVPVSMLEHAKAIAAKDAEIAELRARVAGLESALKDLSDMYGSTWDRVDGALVMMDAGIERFEKAHAAARIALGVPLAGDQGEG